jgi:hypothetical protein
MNGTVDDDLRALLKDTVCFLCLPPVSLVVSQYLILASLSSPPPRSGRAPLTHPAPHGYFPTASCCDLQAGPVIIECPALSLVDALSNIR